MRRKRNYSIEGEIYIKNFWNSLANVARIEKVEIKNNKSNFHIIS